MRVALFVTCLIDLFRPSAGFAAVELLEAVDCVVEVPPGQTCCGQPAYNNGDWERARAIACQVITSLEPYPRVVVPSGSCAGMLVHHYPRLFDAEPAWQPRAEALAARTVELTGFFAERLGERAPPGAYVGRVTCHDSCSARREMAVGDTSQRLLRQLPGVALTDLAEAEVCCGFGGTFCVKYSEISERMVNDKVQAIEASGADTVVSGDLGCLLNIAGRLRRLNSPVRVFHIAELLSGHAQRTAAIGEPQS